MVPGGIWEIGSGTQSKGDEMSKDERVLTLDEYRAEVRKQAEKAGVNSRWSDSQKDMWRKLWGMGVEEFDGLFISAAVIQGDEERGYKYAVSTHGYGSPEFILPTIAQLLLENGLVEKLNLEIGKLLIQKAVELGVKVEVGGDTDAKVQPE